MADADDVKQAVLDSAAAGIKRARGDEGEAEAHSLPDQIEAAKFAASQSAASNSNPLSFMRPVKGVPPGAV